MAVEEECPKPKSPSISPYMEGDTSALLSSYLGISFAVFLGFLPRSSISHVFSLQSRNRILSLKLFHAEEQLRQMRSRRKEDSKSDSRVVEIFSTQRHAWHQEEKRLLHRIDVATEEIAELRSQIGEMKTSEAELRCSIKRLQQEVAERDEMLYFASRREAPDDGITKEKAEQVNEEKEDADFGEVYIGKIRASEGVGPVPDPCFVERSKDLEKMALMYCRENGFGPDSLALPEISKRWTERLAGGWQDIQFDSHESNYHVKHLITRREYPWIVSGDASNISSKLDLLEQKLSNLEKEEKGELPKVPLLLRKQAKRYQLLAGKIDDLCRRMEVSDTCEESLSPEFRTQRQTEFLVEALMLKHRAEETRQKLNGLEAEMAGKIHHLHPMPMPTRRSLDDSIRSNLKEIQRTMEVWLARIMGDLEGILARDGNSLVRDYYITRYPFVRY